MNRKLKTLGLTLVAVFAVSAVAASAASATVFNFYAEAAPATLTGKQHAANDVFTIDAGTVSCTEATYEEKELAFSPAGSFTVLPSYTGCTAFGFPNVPVDVNGCKYRFMPVTKEGGNFEGDLGIGCSGDPITVTSPGCYVTIGTQALLRKITFTNVGAGTTREVTTDIAITGLAYEEHNHGIFPTCAANTAKKTNGTYQGSFLMTGENPTTKAHFGIWMQ